MFAGSLTSSTDGPRFQTTSMKERSAERNGSRRVIYGVKRKDVKNDELLPGVASTELPYTTGGCYVGDWQGDKKEGFGTQTWTNGNKYEGEWCLCAEHLPNCVL